MRYIDVKTEGATAVPTATIPTAAVPTQIALVTHTFTVSVGTDVVLVVFGGLNIGGMRQIEPNPIL